MSKHLITDFYQAFQRGDAAAMCACYHDDIVFSDPAFGTLRGDQAKAMWTMLLANSGSELHIDFGDVTADEKEGSARWTATYNFGPQKRKVVNQIQAKFTFAEGKITTHHDTFDMWRWSRQALGVPGLLLGWTPLIQNKVRQTALKRLDAWMERS